MTAPKLMPFDVNMPRWANAPASGVLEFTEPDGAAPFRFHRARIWP